MFTYVEGSLDNQAESFPRKARFFLLKSKSDRKRNFCSNTNFCWKCSSVHENCGFEETISKILRWNSKHFPLRCRKGSKNKKCSGNILERSYGELRFWQHCKKISAELLIFSALTSETIKTYNFDGNLSHCERIIVQKEYGFDKRTRGFRKSLEILGSNPKKSEEILCYSRKLSPRNDLLYT